jgi:ABC-2 type transport system permease protein
VSVITKIANRYRYPLILLRQMVITDFKLRYQGSVLGYFWSFLKPMALFTILYIVFVRFLKVGADSPNFAIQLLLGVVLWSFFIETTSIGLKAIVERGELIRKINFPRYVIVLATAASAFVNLILNLIVVGVFMFFAHIQFRPVALLSPFLILELFALALATSLMLSALYVRFRDLTYIWEVALQAAFYATPILYPLTKIPAQYVKIIMLNPLAQIVQDMRYVLVTDKTPTVSTIYSFSNVRFFQIAAVVAFAVVSAYYFRARSQGFAEDV